MRLQSSTHPVTILPIKMAAGVGAVNLRPDPDVLKYFRKTGPGWQSRINEALRKAARL